MEKKLQRSVLPIYLFGASWIAYAFVFPLYKGAHFIAAFAVSLAVYALARKLIPPKEVLVEKPPLSKTGNEKADAFIEEINSYVKSLRSYENNIQNGGVRKKTQSIEEITLKIAEYIAEHPDAVPDVRRFANYYLPTTLKLLDSYSELEKQQASTPNIAGTMEKIDKMLDTAIEAFKKQHDSLYEYHAMDRGAEIRVMQDILSSEGLLEKQSKVSEAAKNNAEEDFNKAAGAIELTLEPEKEKEK